MRNITFIITFGLLSAIIAVTANADPCPVKSKQPVRVNAEDATDESLLTLVRRAQSAAEEAKAEAQRAREQSETLKRQLEQTTKELELLKQALSGSQLSDLKSQIAALKTELKAEISKLQPPVPDASASLPDPKPTKAADSSDSKVDDRLAKIEEQVEINSAQIKEQAQTKVESESRFRVRLFGLILANTFINSDDTSIKDEPLYAEPPPDGLRAQRHNLGATLRQTKIGLAMTGPRMGSARLSAEAEFDFWGGPQARFDGDVLGTFRIRTATARIDWDRTTFEVGQREPIISPLNPNSIAAVWFPPLTRAGNLWQWRPQIAIEHRAPLRGSSEMVFQASLMPNFGERVDTSLLEGSPNYEARIAYRHDLDTDRRFEVGFGGHYGKRKFGFDRNVDGFIVAGDWRVPLGNRLEVSGEAYYGRSVSLSEMSGARIDRLFALTGPVNVQGTIIRGIRSTGGWAQLSVQARQNLEFNFAYGQEDPDNNDIRFGLISDTTRFKNQVGSANYIYHLRSNFLISFEYRRLWTDYPTRRFTNNHYNLSFGYLF